MGLYVWVVEELIYTHVSIRFLFEPINKLIGKEIDPNKTLVFRIHAPHELDAACGSD